MNYEKQFRTIPDNMIQNEQMQMETEHEVEFNFIYIEIFPRGAVDDLKFNIEMQLIGGLIYSRQRVSKVKVTVIYGNFQSPAKLDRLDRLDHRLKSTFTH